MAEALLRQTLLDSHVNWTDVTSGGLVASHWGVAHSQLRRVLGQTYKLVENRRSKPLTTDLVASSSLILGMEDRHVNQILERFPTAEGRVDKITSYAGRDGEIRDFPDSEYGDVFSWLQHCHSIMTPCIEIIAQKIIREQDRHVDSPGKLD